MNLSLVQDLSNINGQTCEQRNIEWVNIFYLACFSMRSLRRSYPRVSSRFTTEY